MPGDNFLDKENDEKWYPDKDYHTMYISEIVKVLVKDWRRKLAVRRGKHG